MTSRFFWTLIVVLAAPLFAAPYDPYNTVVVGLADANCEITSVVDPVRVTEWYPFWNDDGSIQSVAAHPHGRVFALLEGPGIEVVELQPDQSKISIFTGLADYTPLSILVDRNGNVYVLARIGVARTAHSSRFRRAERFSRTTRWAPVSRRGTAASIWRPINARPSSGPRPGSVASMPVPVPLCLIF